MRIRTIKPELFSHEGLFDLERELNLPIRFAWAGLFCCADREGRFKWEPRRLGALILPFDSVDFSRVLDALLTRGMLVKYRVGDAWYGAIPTWSRHQFVNPRESASEIPAPSDAQEVDACVTREARVEDASHKEGKGKEGKGRSVGASRSAPAPDDESWLASLRSDPAYAGIDVPTEIAKCRSWCSVHRKPATRRRIIAWLLRVERPVAQVAPSRNGHSSADLYTEPPSDRWRAAARELYPGAVVHEANWFDLGTDIRARVLAKIA